MIVTRTTPDLSFIATSSVISISVSRCVVKRHFISSLIEKFEHNDVICAQELYNFTITRLHYPVPGPRQPNHAQKVTFYTVNKFINMLSVDAEQEHRVAALCDQLRSAITITSNRL